MPRVHKVEKARKSIPHAGIAVGDSYYYWTFKNRMGPGTRMVSKTPPRGSQLTRSEFKSQWRSFGEEIADLALDDGLYEALQDIAGRLRELGEEQQGKLDNMPEGLQQGGTGEMLQERIDACEGWADEIEALEDPGDFDEANVEGLETFDEFLEGGSIEPVPAMLLSSDEYVAEDIAKLQDWAEQAWADWQAERASTIEEARTEYESTLSDLRDEAGNADPGEI